MLGWQRRGVAASSAHTSLTGPRARKPVVSLSCTRPRPKAGAPDGHLWLCQLSLDSPQPLLAFSAPLRYSLGSDLPAPFPISLNDTFLAHFPSWHLVSEDPTQVDSRPHGTPHLNVGKLAATEVCCRDRMRHGPEDKRGVAHGRKQRVGWGGGQVQATEGPKLSRAVGSLEAGYTVQRLF